MRALKNRLSALEATVPDEELGKLFLWPHGQPLQDALAVAGLTLADEPLFAIRLVAAGKPRCHFHETESWPHGHEPEAYGDLDREPH